MLELAGLLDEGDEFGGLACLLEEGVCGEGVGIGASLDLDVDALVEEVVEVGGPASLLLEGRDALGGDEEESAEGRELHIRRLALGHFHHHDAEGPDVDLDAVVLAADELGGHPVRGADDGVALLLLGGELGGVAKVGELDGAVGAEEDVVRLDVAVDAVEAVDVRERAERVADDVRDVALAQTHDVKGLEDVGETAATHVLHDDPHLLVGRHEAVDVVDDVGVVARLHDADLGREQLGVVAVHLHDLHGDDAPVALVLRHEHLARRALADLRKLVKERLRVLLRHQLLQRQRRALLGQRLAELVAGRRSSTDRGTCTTSGSSTGRLLLELLAPRLKLEDVEHGLLVRRLLLLGDATGLEHALPLGREAHKAAARRIKVDVEVVRHVERHPHHTVLAALLDGLNPRVHLLNALGLDVKDLFHGDVK